MRLAITEHESFGVCVSFQGLAAPGFQSLPEEYQLRIEEMEGSQVLKDCAKKSYSFKIYL